MTHELRTVSDVVNQFPIIADRFPRLPAPRYTGWNASGACLAVESMKRHMTDEGWQIMQGLNESGYELVGHSLPNPETDVDRFLKNSSAGIVLLQDKREWDVRPGDFREPRAHFLNVSALAKRPDVFKLTILKDSHQKPGYHRESADEIGCNAWVIYYHPRIVQRLAPYVRAEHTIRTYHSVDPAVIPPVRTDWKRHGCILSGAVSREAYPWRHMLFSKRSELPDTMTLPHPGYHRKGCHTRQYFQYLSHMKIAICTSSVYGYALRKIIEATAAGCIVVTDLPTDEVLPEIDANLVRMSPRSTAQDVAATLRVLYDSYDPARQAEFAAKAREFYDYRNVCQRLADDIGSMRLRYYNESV